VGTPHAGGSIGSAVVEVVEVSGVAMMPPQLDTERTMSAPPNADLNLAMATLPRRRQEFLLLLFGPLRCFPSNTDRQSFVRDLPMSS